MHLDLTSQEAALLKRQLTRQLDTLERDLVRTDKYELQHALARDVETLRAIESRLANGIAGSERTERDEIV